MTPEDYLKQGDIQQALSGLQQLVRNQPANAEKRVFLFQLLAVMGQWDRALNQLNVIAELDDSALAMVYMYREVLKCEVFREKVFQGEKTPLIFGDPPEWIAPLLESLKSLSRGDDKASQMWKEQAFEIAPASAGNIDGVEFQWIADSDQRLGPVIEAFIEGRYFWVPVQQIHSITLEPPEDLRDIVWIPAQFTWWNGGESFGVIPVRYPGSYDQGDDALALSRKTQWAESNGENYIGYGQRILVTDTDEYPLLEIRQVTFQPTEESVGTVDELSESHV